MPHQTWIIQEHSDQIYGPHIRIPASGNGLDALAAYYNIPDNRFDTGRSLADYINSDDSQRTVIDKVYESCGHATVTLVNPSGTTRKISAFADEIPWTQQYCNLKTADHFDTGINIWDIKQQHPEVRHLRRNWKEADYTPGQAISQRYTQAGSSNYLKTGHLYNFGGRSQRVIFGADNEALVCVAYEDPGPDGNFSAILRNPALYWTIRASLITPPPDAVAWCGIHEAMVASDSKRLED